MEKLVPYLNVSKNCKNGTGCFKSENFKGLNGFEYVNMDSYTEDAKVLLSNGMSLNMHSNDPNCLMSVGTGSLSKCCGSLTVVVGGKEGEYRHGKDIFLFWVAQDGIIPAGTPDDADYKIDDCKLSGKGVGCVAWVIQKGNFDYLRRKVSWNE